MYLSKDDYIIIIQYIYKVLAVLSRKEQTHLQLKQYQIDTGKGKY